jgi:hypothetical protein
MVTVLTQRFFTLMDHLAGSIRDAFSVVVVVSVSQSFLVNPLACALRKLLTDNELPAPLAPLDVVPLLEPYLLVQSKDNGIGGCERPIPRATPRTRIRGCFRLNRRSTLHT